MEHWANMVIQNKLRPHLVEAFLGEVKDMYLFLAVSCNFFSTYI